MTKKSMMMKTMMEMIMLMMVNKMMLMILVSPMNFENGIIWVVHPNWVMVASTFHVGIGLSNKIGCMRSWRVHVGPLSPRTN